MDIIKKLDNSIVKTRFLERDLIKIKKSLEEEKKKK